MLKSPDLPPSLVKPGSTPNPFGAPLAHPIDYPSDFQPTPGTAVATTTAATTSTDVSATSVHQALVAIAIMSAFVYLMTLLAGTSPAAGKIIATLFIGLLLIQGATHVNPFVEWVNKHPLQPTS